MRTLLHVYPSFEVGGSQRRFAQVCKNLGAEYHHIIASLDGAWGAVELLTGGISFEKLTLPPQNTSTLETIKVARNVLSDKQPDVLATYNWGAIEWAAANLLPICPHVHIEDGFRPDEVSKRITRRNLFRRLVLRGNSRLVVISETLLKIALEEWKISPHRTQFVPNGINVEKYAEAAKAPTTRPQGITDDDIVIGTVAALRPEKDIAALIEVFGRLDTGHQVKLAIYGDGQERADLEALANSLGLGPRVIFAGYTDKPEEALATMDVFALSSRTEQMPLSILEAMAAGLPIASYAVGDVASMVSSSNAPYVVERNADKLQRALEELISKPETRKSVGEDNYARVTKTYAEEEMYAAYQTLFGPNR